MDTRAGIKSTTTSADITFLQQGHKPKDKEKGSEENKQFDPGGKGEKTPLWNAAVTLSSFFCGERGAMGGLLLMLRVFFCLCFMFFSCLALFYNYCSFQMIISQRAEKHERRRGPSR